MEKDLNSLKLKNSLCFPIYLCSKEVIKRYSLLLEELDLTYTQYVVMMYFWERKKSNVKELGKTLLLDSSTLTPLLKKLESKGYLSRERSTKDERNLNVAITSKGIKLKKKVLPIPRKMEEIMGITDEEENSLYQILYKILINIENDENNSR